MRILFLDSNIFLQCRDLKDIPWESLFNDREELTLLVPRAVQQEIDNFKGQGNTRRSKRARTASSYFKRILTESEQPRINNSVRIGFPSRKELSNAPRNKLLNPDRKDDSIIQDILSYKYVYPNEEIYLLSDDTNLIASAKEFEISFICVPDDWLLEPEPDAKEIRLRQLEEKLRALETQYPQLNISYEFKGKKVSSLNLIFTEYSDLSDLEIDRLIDQVTEENPMQTDFSTRRSDSIFDSYYRCHTWKIYTTYIR